MNRLIAAAIFTVTSFSTPLVEHADDDHERSEHQQPQQQHPQQANQHEHENSYGAPYGGGPTYVPPGDRDHDRAPQYVPGPGYDPDRDDWERGDERNWNHGGRYGDDRGWRGGEMDRDEGGWR